MGDAEHPVPLAEQTGGRTIHGVIDVVLAAPQKGETGHTAPARAIGEGLIQEMGLLVKNAGEAEGFEVDVKIMVKSVY